jgi:SAM-dependent methyltransferase
MIGCADALCPACAKGLRFDSEISCLECGASYPRVAGIPVLLPRPEAHRALWRGQLALLLERGDATLTALSEAATGGGETTRQRLLSLGAAVKAQVSDIAAVLGPALGGAQASGATGLPRGVVEHIGYLYRDWGWRAVGYRENDAAVEALAALCGEEPLGRTLVLGAGACGLPYELYWRCRASAMVAIDIDPYLLVMAEHILRGRALKLTEASLKVMALGEVSRTWTLTAEHPALEQSVFQLLLADGLEPPFPPESFDSVLTPWFIDQVPRDLPAFFGRVRRLLRPGGRYFNQGPLIYPEQTPFPARYCREELFELAHAAGLRVGEWSSASRPYLVSPLSGGGKHESVLSFVARRPAW